MIDVILKENERIDDLEINGFRIIQNPFCFCFGMDAVLLANFARISPKADVIDLGTGTGIVPLLLAAKSKGQSWTGLEIQENMVDMARRSVEMNEVTEKVNILQGDLKAAAASYLLKTNGTFTMVHRPSRLPEIMEMMVKYRLEPKRMQLVQPTVDKEPNLVLIEGVKEAGRECRILPTLAVYDEEGNYTEELLRYYGKEK